MPAVFWLVKNRIKLHPLGQSNSEYPLNPPRWYVWSDTASTSARVLVRKRARGTQVYTYIHVHTSTEEAEFQMLNRTFMLLVRRIRVLWSSDNAYGAGAIWKAAAW